MSKEFKLFFSTNCISGYENSVREVCHDMNIVPLVYSGITLSVKESSLDKEIRNNLYAAKVAVLLIVARSSTGERVEVEDNWALEEKDSIVKSDIRFLVYVLQEVSQTDIDKLNLPVDVIRVENETAFKESLKKEISSLIE